MKKILKLITLDLVVCMAFSTVAFAAESEMSVSKVSGIQKNVSDMTGKVGIEPREPAAQITSATIVGYFAGH